MSIIIPTEEGVVQVVNTHWRTPSKGDISYAFAKTHPDWRDQGLYTDQGTHLRRFFSTSALDRVLDRLIAQGGLIKLRGSEISLRWHGKQQNAFYYYTPETLAALRQTEIDQRNSLRRKRANAKAEAEVLAKYADEVAALTDKYYEEQS